MKALSIKKYEFEVAIGNLINGSELPAFVIESILKDTIAAVRLAADEQLKKDLKEYRDELAKGKMTSDVHE